MLLAFNSNFSWLMHRFPDSRTSRKFHTLPSLAPRWGWSLRNLERGFIES